MRIGASRNPNLIEKEENLKLCDLDLFDSNDLTGEFIFDRLSDCSFSSNLTNLRTQWRAPDAPVIEQVFLYFEYTDHLNGKSKFKKSIDIHPGVSIYKPHTYSNDQKNSQKMDQEFDEECLKIYQ